MFIFKKMCLSIWFTAKLDVKLLKTNVKEFEKKIIQKLIGDKEKKIDLKTKAHVLW